MNRVAAIRLAVAAVIGAALATVLLALVSLLNPGRGFSLATIATASGWTVPLVAGLTSAGLAWALLQCRRSPEDHDSAACRLTCPSCGGTVGCDWRLCPHCGERIQ